MATWTFSDFKRAQHTPIQPARAADLSGRNVLVVGASAGIGLEACKQYASMSPARLIMVCRTHESGRGVLAAVAESTGYDRAEVRAAELGSFAAVRKLADSIISEDLTVDILVYNAGCYQRRYITTEDGYELSLQVNHLSAALLAFLLLPQMLKAKESFHPRLVILSTEAILGRHGHIDPEIVANGKILETYNDPSFCARRGYFLIHRYTDTKLINALWARVLSARLGTSSSLIVTRVMPGLCSTTFFHNWKFPLSLIWKLSMALYARTPEMGARVVVGASLSGHEDAPLSEDELRGSVVETCRIRPDTEFILGDVGRKAEKIIWDETLSLLTAIDPRVAASARALHT